MVDIEGPRRRQADRTMYTCLMTKRSASGEGSYIIANRSFQTGEDAAKTTSWVNRLAREKESRSWSLVMKRATR